MKKKKVFSLLIAALIIFSNIGTVYAKDNTESKKEIVFSESYMDKQLDNNTLFDKALKGDVVKDDFTQVDVSYQNNGKTKVIKINKKLGIEKFDNGDVVEHCSVTSLFIQTIIEDNNYLTAAGDPGGKEETGTSGSYTIRNTVGFYYDKMTPDNGTTYCYNINTIYSTPSVIDSGFTMTNLYQYCHLAGAGYTAAKVPTTMTESDKSYSVANPTSNTKYSISTGYVKYVLVNDASGFGTTATVSYKRINSSTVYTYSYSVILGA